MPLPSYKARADAHAESLEEHESGDEFPAAAEFVGSVASACAGGADEGKDNGDDVGEAEDERELMGVAGDGGKVRLRCSESEAFPRRVTSTLLCWENAAHGNVLTHPAVDQFSHSPQPDSANLFLRVTLCPAPIPAASPAAEIRTPLCSSSDSSSAPRASPSQSSALDGNGRQVVTPGSYELSSQMLNRP